MQTAFKGNPVKMMDQMPVVGDKLADFQLTKGDLSNVSLSDFQGPTIIFTMPSLETHVCADETKKFNEEASKISGANVLAVTRDLPFAQKRFCEANGIDHVTALSDMRDPQFANRMGVFLADGPLQGLMARAVFVLDASHVIRYIEVTKDITEEPNYAQAIAAIQ